MNKNSAILARAAELKREGKLNPNPNNKKLFHKSETEKLDGIPSWSTQAWVSCPGKTNSPVCEICYAMEGRYVFGRTIKPRVSNMEMLSNPDFVREAVKTIRIYAYFRLFDSGDFQSPEAIRIWTTICSLCPDTKFWIPTRTHKIPQFSEELKKLEALPNVVVRRSSDSLTGEFTPGLHGSTIVDSYQATVPGVHVCQALAPENNRKCNGCRVCWDKTVPVIGYPGHGVMYKSTLNREKT
jgi:hypothetical protein